MGEQLAHPAPQLRVSDTGIPGAEAAGLELPGQCQQLIGGLQLALCGHGSEPPGLELANHRMDVVHAGMYTCERFRESGRGRVFRVTSELVCAPDCSPR